MSAQRSELEARLVSGDAPDEARLPATARYRDAARSVRFDECARDGRMRAAAILRHAQDLAWQHSERLEYGRAWYEARGVGWVVRSIDMVLDEMPRANAALVGTTALVGFRHVMARRRTRIFTGEGRVAADAIIDWVMTDAAGKPTRFPAEFEPFVASIGATFAPTKVGTPATESPLLKTTIALRAADVDPLGHINNAAWLEVVDEALAQLAPDQLAATRRHIRLEYLALARGAAVDVLLYPHAGGAAQGYALSVLDSDGTLLLRGETAVVP